jgi:hypothetical protein
MKGAVEMYNLVPWDDVSMRHAAVGLVRLMLKRIFVLQVKYKWNCDTLRKKILAYADEGCGGKSKTVSSGHRLCRHEPLWWIRLHKVVFRIIWLVFRNLVVCA